jgi:ribonuclease PH
VIPAVPVKHFVAAISVGVYQGMPVLDLDYIEDSGCDTDMNVVMTDPGTSSKCRARPKARRSTARA